MYIYTHIYTYIHIYTYKRTAAILLISNNLLQLPFSEAGKPTVRAIIERIYRCWYQQQTMG